MRRNLCDLTSCKKRIECNRYKKAKKLRIIITNCYRDEKIIQMKEYDLY